MQVKMIDIEKIKPSPFQTRQNFDEEDLKGLAETYERRGIIDPLSVRATNNGYFELISGERRLRAAKIAELKEIPCMVKELSDKDARYEQFIENIQRKALDPIGRARALDSLMKQEGWKGVRKASRETGIGESTIDLWLSVFKMPINVQKKIVSEKVSFQKIRKIGGLSLDEDKQIIFEKMTREELPQKRVFEIVDAFKEIDSDLTFTIEEKKEAKKRIIEAKEFIESPQSIIADMKWQKEHSEKKDLQVSIGEFALTLAAKMGKVALELKMLAKSWKYLPKEGQRAVLSHLNELNQLRKKLETEGENA